MKTLTLAVIFCSPRKCTAFLQKLIIKPYSLGVLQLSFDILRVVQLLGAKNTKVVRLIPAWAIHLQVGLDDPYVSLLTQSIL